MIKYAPLLILFLSFQCYGTTSDYWSLSIPVPENARNVTHEKDSDFFSITTSYDIDIPNTQNVYKLYDNYFSSIGWKNPFNEILQPKSKAQGTWSSYQMHFNKDDRPEVIYGSIWKSNDIPANGSVQLTLSDYNNGVFSASVKVVIAPEVDASPLMELKHLVTKNPTNFFNLYKALGANPFDVDKALKSRSKASDTNEIVRKYYHIIDKVTINYKKFGDQHIRAQ